MLVNSARVFLSVSRFHIIAIAMLGTLTFGWLFSGKYLFAVMAICGIDWFVVNLLNRVVDIPEDTANGIVGTSFVASHQRFVLAVGFGALFASLVIAHLWLPELTPWRIGYQVLGLTYNWRLLPGGRRIKELYFFKNTSSGVGFLLTVFVYPLVATESSAFAPGISWATVFVSGVFFLLFELSYEAIYDLRDAPGDAEAGVQTYAVVHGEKGALAIIDTLIACSVLALIAGYASGALPWRIFVMIIGPLMQVFLYKRAYKRGITSKDCIVITWAGAGLLGAYHLWILLGLPWIGV